MTGGPTTFEGRRVQSVEDAKTLASAALGGHLSSLPSDQGPFDALVRAYRAVEATIWASAFVEAMAEALDDPRHVEAAIHFFTVISDVDDGGALIARVRGARSGAQPLDPDVLSRALHAAGRRMLSGDATAITFGRDDIEQGEAPEAYIAALTRVESDWVSQHAPDLVKRYPQVALAILVNLQAIGVDPTALGITIASDAKRDPSFVDMLERFIDNPGPIQKALDS